MAEPTDSTLPDGVELRRLNKYDVAPSPALIMLLVDARSSYDWPNGTGASISQQVVIDLENEVAIANKKLDEESAHAIICRVSRWAGNKANAHAAILNADFNAKRKMLSALCLLQNLTSQKEGLDLLSDTPGISLVIASKIFRFISSQNAAAVDRHASYFFNSLEVVSHPQGQSKSTQFKREWVTRNHTSSRLATFSTRAYERNRQEYTEVYLPLLAQISEKLNALQIKYVCAASGEHKMWRPTDVEMAAYYWWACNGTR